MNEKYTKNNIYTLYSTKDLREKKQKTKKERTKMDRERFFENLPLTYLPKGRRLTMRCTQLLLSQYGMKVCENIRFKNKILTRKKKNKQK